jgi:hypothetical protein
MWICCPAATSAATATQSTWVAPTCGWRTCSWGSSGAPPSPHTSGARGSLPPPLGRCYSAALPPLASNNNVCGLSFVSSILTGASSTDTLLKRLPDLPCRLPLAACPPAREWPIPEDHFDSDRGTLLRFVAERTAEVVRQHGEAGGSRGEGQGEEGGPVAVGFCFSFPVEQTALDNGKVLGWTKVNRAGMQVEGMLGCRHEPHCFLLLARISRRCCLASLWYLALANQASDLLGPISQYMIDMVVWPASAAELPGQLPSGAGCGGGAAC